MANIKNTTQQWDDVLIRSSFSDTGKIPTSGTASHSPDIIPWGPALLTNPEQALITDDNWGKYLGKNISQGEANYLYMRGINLSDGAKEGKFYLYFAPCGMLQYPGDWSRNYLMTSTGVDHIKFTAGAKDARVATNEPFQWIPGPVDGHYCLIGRIWTQEHPNEIPKIYKITDFARYILDNPNMAWRNVSMVANNVPFQTAWSVYDQGDEEHDMDVGITWKNLVPNKTWVSFSCGTLLPGGEPWFMPKTLITVKNGKQFVPGGVIFAHWKSKITYSVWFDCPAPPDWEIEATAQYISTSSDVLYDRATLLEDLGVPGRKDVDGGPVKAIPVGGDVMKPMNP